MQELKLSNVLVVLVLMNKAEEVDLFLLNVEQHFAVIARSETVFLMFACFQVVVLVYHWGSGVLEQPDLLISKPVVHWTPEEVASWLEDLGPWTEPYRKPFQQENVNGR